MEIAAENGTIRTSGNIALTRNLGIEGIKVRRAGSRLTSIDGPDPHTEDQEENRRE